MKRSSSKPSGSKGSRPSSGSKPAKKRGKPAAGSSARSAADAKKATKPTKLRIIGGHMRGRTVVYHGEEFTRPMKDNIRENAFNILNRAAKGAKCFDLFAGTGAMAFESISRGAISAVMVEQNRRAARFVRETTESLGIESKVKIVTADTFRIAGELLGPPEDETAWLVFLCPPYILWHERLEDLNAIIRSVLVNAPPGSVLMVETEKTFDQDLLPPGDWDRRTYGGTTLGFIEPAQVCGMNL
ncbi:Ribosomal RNA small subunit methyltransferase D [Rubripirellula lacrimiformis]|uniref:Ribosomal RNA small subunit methyltransferase D n=1 Tax=Rubripirellula lacrimiformis TaxID=1930273 RepID=A0A517NBZ9_9BACT|nr:RsmD family RNA methyltransferase [Rubripirellula lacrimiformis]QDT04666.1 Ribosomal RNA small subunit methyltransferase D [Rubripirellula lacrimiformis]